MSKEREPESLKWVWWCQNPYNCMLWIVNPNVTYEVKWSEVAQSCPILCDPMDSSLHQAPPSMGFSRQEYWSGLSFPSPSVQFSRSVVSDSLWPHESQHIRPPCPSPTPGVHSDSRPSSQWCHPAISSSVLISIFNKQLKFHKNTFLLQTKFSYF